MLFTATFRLRKKQNEVDFVNIYVNSDLPLFIDPFSISVIEDPWYKISHNTLVDYFETLTDQNGEFKIPGKGLILFHNVNPPKVKIFKTGYAFMYLDDLGVHFRRDSLYSDQVAWINGKPIISFRKKSIEERKKAVKREGGIPFNEMAIPGLPEEKYRLYHEEVSRAYHVLGMIPYWEQDHRYIQIKKGGVYPAQEIAVDPVKGD